MTSEPGSAAMERIIAGLEGVTPGPWHPGCLSNDDHPCNCKSICDEGYAGGIASVHVGNGLPIGDGGNDAPPVDEAKANLRHIARCDPDTMRSIAAYIETLTRERDEAREALKMVREWFAHISDDDNIVDAADEADKMADVQIAVDAAIADGGAQE